MDYILTFSVDERGEERNVTDIFVAHLAAQQAGPRPAGPDMWLYAPGAGFRRTSDEDGTALTTEGFDRSRLHRVLVDFFGYVGSGKGYAAIASTNPDASVSAVLISNDPAVTPDPLGSESRGMLRRYQASSILTGAELFGAIHDNIFGLAGTQGNDQPEEPEVESVTRNLGDGPWIFNQLSAPTDVTEMEETAFLIGGAGSSPQDALRRVLNIPEVTVYADDFFTYEDPANQARAMAQPFPTDAGLFTEIRLELPPGQTAEQLRYRLATQVGAAGYADVYMIQGYDDAEGLVRVAPLRADSSLGPMRVLKQSF